MKPKKIISCLVVAIGLRAPANACRDPDDLHLLGLAEAGHASFLVSGDKDLLVLDPYQGTRIVTPRHFWESMRSG
jgi:predicted nucleic acid-binding protein